MGMHAHAHTHIRIYIIFTLCAHLCPTLCDTMNCSFPGSSRDSPGKNTGVPSPSPGDLTSLEIKPGFPVSPVLWVDFYQWAIGKAIYMYIRTHTHTHTHTHIHSHTKLSLSLLSYVQFSCVWLFATPWTIAHQASLSVTNSWSLLKLISIKLLIPFNHRILCYPLLLLPSIFLSVLLHYIWTLKTDIYFFY